MKYKAWRPLKGTERDIKIICGYCNMKCAEKGKRCDLNQKYK